MASRTRIDSVAITGTDVVINGEPLPYWLDQTIEIEHGENGLRTVWLGVMLIHNDATLEIEDHPQLRRVVTPDGNEVVTWGARDEEAA